MAIKSQFSGKCKDCGKAYNTGDEIDTNGKESPNKNGEMKAHWCPDGENCKGNMQLQGSLNPTDGPTITPQTGGEPQSNIAAKIEALEANYNAIPEDQKPKYGIFVLYKEHLKRCRDMGITNHIEAQMLFKTYIHRMGQ